MQNIPKCSLCNRNYSSKGFAKVYYHWQCCAAIHSQLRCTPCAGITCAGRY